MALEMKAANESIVRFLEAIGAEGADYASAMDAWDHPGQPEKAGVEEVLALPQAEREALWRAVEEDIGFDASIDDEAFVFAFAGLAERTRRAGKRLLASMYDSVFAGKGFALPAHSEVNRTTWEYAFRAANPAIRVCPACLINSLEWRIEGRAASDADHYLPRNLYPALSVHGMNLVPICKNCNRTAKGPKDPLAAETGAHALTKVWFPYRDIGIASLELDFAPATPSMQGLISLRGTPGTEQQAELFDALFRLSSRWSEGLDNVHWKVVLQLRDRFDDGQFEIEGVKAALRRMAATMKAGLTKIPGEYVAGCYCAWLADSPSALASLVEELREG